MDKIKNWLKESLTVFGFEKTRLELFIHGLIFLVIKSVYDAVLIGGHLPKNWREGGIKTEIENPIGIYSYLLLLVSYFIFNFTFFYDKEKSYTKTFFDGSKVFFNKIILIFCMILFYSLLFINLIFIFF